MPAGIISTCEDAWSAKVGSVGTLDPLSDLPHPVGTARANKLPSTIISIPLLESSSSSSLTDVAVVETVIRLTSGCSRTVRCASSAHRTSPSEALAELPSGVAACAGKQRKADDRMEAKASECRKHRIGFLMLT